MRASIFVGCCDPSHFDKLKSTVPAGASTALVNMTNGRTKIRLSLHPQYLQTGIQHAFVFVNYDGDLLSCSRQHLVQHFV
jgi:hypothetical protein